MSLSMMTHRGVSKYPFPVSLPHHAIWDFTSGFVYSDDGSTVAVNNDPIYHVRDRSINSHHLIQTSVAERATFSTDDYADFDGLNDNYDTDAFEFTSSDSMFFFVVDADDDISGSSEYSLFFGYDSVSGNWAWMCIDKGQWGLVIDDVDARVDGFVSTTSLTGKAIITYSFIGLSRKLYINGVQQWEMTAAQSHTYAFYNFANFLGASSWKGKMYYAAATNGLSNNSANEYGNYLANRFSGTWTNL